MRTRLCRIAAICLGIALILGINIASDLWVHPRPTHAQSNFAPFVCINSLPISQTANATIIPAGSTNTYTYICSISYGTGGTAETGSVVEGTGAACVTTVNNALIGGTTAAAGGPIGSSPVQVGGGVGFILKTKVAGDNVCLFVSGAAQVGGYVTYAYNTF